MKKGNGSILSAREVSVLELTKRGQSAKEIANELFLSQETVRKHLQNCYKKLGANNKIEALRKAGMI